jgi:hypothetical protein
MSGPKGSTPSGRHWYYRIDRPTRKHCWYLGDESARTNKIANVKPVETSAAAQDDSPAASLKSSVANARAEFPPVDTTISAPPQNAQPAEPAPDATMPNEDTRRLTTHDLITQAPIALASRWPLPNEFQPTQTDPTPQEPAQNSVDPPRQSAQKTGTRIGPLQIFLCVVAIALALAAILGRVIFQHTASARRKQSAHIRQRPIWPERIPQSGVRPSYAQMVTPERRARTMRADREVTDEIENLLRGVSRRHG